MTVKISYTHTKYWEEEYETLEAAFLDIQTRCESLPKGEKLEGAAVIEEVVDEGNVGTTAHVERGV